MSNLNLNRIASEKALQNNTKESEFNKIHRITTHRSSSAVNLSSEIGDFRNNIHLEYKKHSHRYSKSKDAFSLI